MPASINNFRQGLVRRLSAAVLTLVLLMTGVQPGFAVFSGDMSPRAPSGDARYAAGMEAWAKEDWEGVVYWMAQVVGHRPRHDNAWARLGYAHRKLRHYTASLSAYGEALKLNPHNRAALEYLGEAYIELGRFIDAVDVLQRLAVECKRVALTFSDGNFHDGCIEYASLKNYIDLIGVDSNAASIPWNK